MVTGLSHLKPNNSSENIVPQIPNSITGLRPH